MRVYSRMCVRVRVASVMPMCVRVRQCVCVCDVRVIASCQHAYAVRIHATLPLSIYQNGWWYLFPRTDLPCESMNLPCEMLIEMVSYARRNGVYIRGVSAENLFIRRYAQCLCVFQAFSACGRVFMCRKACSSHPVR